MYLSSKKIFSTAAAEVDCSTCMECPAQIGEPRWADCGDESETEETYPGTPSSTSAGSECGGTDDTETSRFETADDNLVFGDSREVFEESFKAQDAKWQNEPERFAVQRQIVFDGPPMPLASHLCGLAFQFPPPPFVFAHTMMPVLTAPVQVIPHVLPLTVPCSEVASPCTSCRRPSGPADHVIRVEEHAEQSSARVCQLHKKLVCNFKEREFATHGKKKCQCLEKGIQEGKGRKIWEDKCHHDECVRLWHEEKTAIREKANEHKAMREAYRTSAPLRNAPQRAGPRQTRGANWQGRGAWGQRW
mmetsp:Transcript_45941/g.98198  ORF Transcript_45941/g.98198 Transcript_45941/m.98198 type:complete len:304 (+) Transcript_45941:50-961(+)